MSSSLLPRKRVPSTSLKIGVATAIVHGLTVVTRNVSDFDQFEVAILNPFENT